jgi:PTH1 family peptidyl-tRNA hydrolase
MRTRIVIGIGNRGSKYAGTRHNIGFEVLDALARRLEASFRPARFPAEVAEGRHKNAKLVLVKPATFVNDSGDVIGPLRAEHEDLEERLLVVCDDMDLPLGRLRARPKGSSGGHHGLDSIMAALGTSGFARLRIGIGRPGSGAVDHVLSKFTRDELQAADGAVRRAADAVTDWALCGIEHCMNLFNREPEEPRTIKGDKQE